MVGVAEKGEAMDLKVSLLGPFKVEINGKETLTEQWKSKKALTLFKYFLTRPGEKIHKDVLIEILWPEDSVINNSHNLHTAIYFLRRAIEPDLGRYKGSSFIRQSSGLYWFDPADRCVVDTIQFEQLIEKSRDVENTDPDAALDAALAALALYRGKLLPEDAYEDWAAGPREYFLEKHIEATLRAAHLLAERRRDYDEALRLCRAALNADVYREELHQAIISLLIQAGRYPAAVAQYRQCAQLLQDEFGLEPSPKTRALYTEMKRLMAVDDLGVVTHESQEEASGPFMCDRHTFDSIHELELRRQRRTGDPISLITIAPKDEGKIFLPDERQEIANVLNDNLRKGDVVCMGDRAIHIQLPKTGETPCRIVVRRLTGALTEVKILSYVMDSTSTEPEKAYL